MVEIANVKENSLAHSKGIEPGDKLLKINGLRPRDYIDYMNCVSAGQFELEIQKKKKKNSKKYTFNRSYGDEIGLEFASIVFDELLTCDNSCEFCFIDQQPPGLRDSLMCKDDDYRFSFLQGSFITLTNLNEEELERIVNNHLSPLYISVHTTNPDLRRKIMNNPRAGKIKQQLEFLAHHNIQFHLQLVICPGINDGSELDRTFADLQKFSESLLSIGIVPVGITSWREADNDLTPFNSEGAREILIQIEKWQDKYAQNQRENCIYAADEFYLLADKKIPKLDSYGSFPQLENGIGLTRLSRHNYWKKRQIYPDRIRESKHLEIITSKLGNKALQPIWNDMKKIDNLKLSVQVIDNNYLGEEVTVTGLLFGRDILDQISGKNCADIIILPEVIFNDDGLTLDDYSQQDFQSACVNAEVLSCSSMAEVLEVGFDDK